MSRRRASLGGTAAAVILALATACTQGSPEVSNGSATDASSAPVATTSLADPSSGTSSTGTTDTSTPSGDAGLESFYGQQLSWSECDGAQCATLRVPVDYDEPGGETIEISLLKVPARGDRIGSLVINPGGPGGSGVDYAKWALGGGGLVASEAVAKRYDIVGFDPRGVGRSAPIECYDATQMDAFLAFDPTPDDDAEVIEIGKQLAAFAAACQQKNPNLLENVSTVDVAKDMDILRSALGDEKLNFLGKSYGTFLGATYAELFPDRAGRMVLDGAMDPKLTALEVSLGQAEGFDRATAAYIKDCVGGGDCPLGGSEEEAVQGLKDFFKQVDAQPLPVKGDPRISELTEGWAVLGVAAAMYDQGSWGILTDALRSAKGGDGSSLMQMANAYADRKPDGSYGNMMQVIYAVNCLDRPDASPKPQEEIRSRFEEKAPIWGTMQSWATISCKSWPVTSDDAMKPGAVTAAGSGPILVVGTTRDPATPYEWAVSLADQLDAGHLLTFDGDGHTAYRRSNECVDNAVDAYLLDGAVPAEGATC